ncbi:MAG: calcium-binding protein, partial [Pseudomonadota bacterium]
IDGDDDTDDTDDDDDVGGGVVLPGSLITGTPLADILLGTSGGDNIVAFASDDVAVGGAGADSISAGEGADFIDAGLGRDVIFGGDDDDQIFGGEDADIIFGDDGADRLFGEDGDDLITAGAGNDTVFGGAGNDLLLAEIGDGDDVYFGDEGDCGILGIDTLDMTAVSANVTVHLGNGELLKGFAYSSQTGYDTLWGIENVNTGFGNDTITASNAVNVMDGGAGNDTFVFPTIQAANGDRIVGFEPGDKIDLSGIDANATTAGNQSFTLLSGGAFTAAGQLSVSFETRDGNDVTVIRGNVNANTDADFELEIEGHHELNNQNLNL